MQEFQEKTAAIGEASTGEDRAFFHLIGPLQNNKTRKAAELFDAVDTVDSLKTGQRLGSAAVELGKELAVLVEVKLSPEDSKHGIDPADLPALLDQLAGVDGIRVQGLMTVPPWSEDPEVARPYFRRLHDLRERFRSSHASLQELSMGMSNDFAVAIEEGSTMIRVGTALFGRRPKP